MQKFQIARILPPLPHASYVPGVDTPPVYIQGNSFLPYTLQTNAEVDTESCVESQIGHTRKS